MPAVPDLAYMYAQRPLFKNTYITHAFVFTYLVFTQTSCNFMHCVLPLPQVQDIQAAVQFMRSMGKTVACVLGHSKVRPYAFWLGVCQSTVCQLLLLHALVQLGLLKMHGRCHRRAAQQRTPGSLRAPCLAAPSGGHQRAHLRRPARRRAQAG